MQIERILAGCPLLLRIIVQVITRVQIKDDLIFKGTEYAYKCLILL